MRMLAYLFAGILVLGLVQYVALIMCIGLLLLLVWGALARPRETFALFGLGLIGSLIDRYPLYIFGFLGVVALCDAVYRRARKPQVQAVPLLPPPHPETPAEGRQGGPLGGDPGR